VEELTVAAGKNKTTVNVEVRQKRTYVKRSDADVAGIDPEREEAQRKLAESQARNQAELAALSEGDRKKREEADRKVAEAEAARVALEQEEADRKRAEAEAEARANAPEPAPEPEVAPEP